MTALKTVLLKIGIAAVAALLAAAVFSSCRSAPETPSPAGPPESAGSVSLPGADILMFENEEEAHDAIYGLQKAQPERGLYEPEDLLRFENAATEAIVYLRKNRDDADYLSRCAELYRNMLEAKKSMRIRTGDNPRVYLYYSSEPTRDAYVSCSVYVTDKTGGLLPQIRDGEAQVRIRGNSTSDAEKKPYNLKLSSDRALLGMESGRKWALLANHFDKTLMRNKLAMDLALEAGCYAALESRMADVYVNGTLKGTYLVCEPVTDGKHRADIDVSAGDFMVERVKNWAPESEHMFFTDGMGLRFDVNYAADDRKAAQTVSRAERAILSGNEDAIRSVLDVESFAAMYAVQEIVKDCDLFYGNCHLCWKDGLLRCGPMWDMDLSMGNVSDRYDEEKYRIYNNLPPFGDGSGDSATGLWADGEWFAALLRCPFFRDLVKNQFRILEPLAEQLYETGGKMDALLEAFGNSFARNYAEAGWTLSGQASPYESAKQYETYDQSVEELRAWLKRRVSFLRTVYGF